MGNANTILALKPYLEAIEQCCRKLSHDELCDVIRTIAQEIAPRERAGFLTKLESRLEQPDEGCAETDLDDELLARIRELKSEISDRQAAIEDGTYYEEYGSYEDYDYYDEEIEALTQEQREELTTLLAETDHLFLANELELAEQAYRLLLNMFGSVGPREEEEEEEFYYSMSEYDVKINWRETRARYCRCVYETCSPEERVDRMVQGMQVHVNMFDSRYAPIEVSYPMLRDVVDARPGELNDWQIFLTNWQQSLKNRMNNRACVLLLEAIQYSDGLEGVAREVRAQRLPVGYLYWLDQLVTEGVWPEVALIAREGLEKMPKGALRAQAAEILGTAGVQIKDDALILQGKQEQFYSTPSDHTLAALVEEAGKQQVRTEILEQARGFLEQAEGAVALKIKTFLMLGRLAEARELVDTDKALGWSYGATGLGVFFGSVLTALTHADEQGVTILAVLQRYAANQPSYYEGISMTQQVTSPPSLVQEIQQGLQNIDLDKADKKRWFELAKKMGGGRIDGIVSNQHRNAYDRAAEVLCALMECCLLNDDQAQARLLLETYRKEKYPRHSAFRGELDRIMRSSTILRPYSKK